MLVTLGSWSNHNTMNHIQIVTTLNVLFLSCGYQIQFFSPQTRSFKLHFATLIYFGFLVLWYALCFKQHFSESSIFNFLIDAVPILHKCIRFHLLMGLKVWLLVIFEMKHVTMALNDLIKALPCAKPSWSWSDLIAYSLMFSGLLLNFCFGFYIMVEMKFRLPTIQQLMHSSALFLPHFTLACSVKLLNLATFFVGEELQKMHSLMKEIVCPESVDKKAPAVSIENNDSSSIELPDIPIPNFVSEIRTDAFDSLVLLTRRLECMAKATQKINQVIQKQVVFLFVMNSISLLGASYSIVYYKVTWHLILDGPVGRILLAFNIGVFVFILWDYISICIINWTLEKKRQVFFEEITKILRKETPLRNDVKALLKDIKFLLKYHFDMRIFYTASITGQCLVAINTLIGLAITIFIVYNYLIDQIEYLESQVEGLET